MTDVSYVPGGRIAIAGDRCWMLTDAEPDSAAVDEIWLRIEQSPRLEELMASLLRIGLEHFPDFALLVVGDGRHHLICRGGGSATLTANGPAERVNGNGLATWREHPVGEDVARIVLGDPPASTDLQLPASGGVFLASSVTVALTAEPRGRRADDAIAVPATSWRPPDLPWAAGAGLETPGPSPVPAADNAGDASATLTYCSDAADDSANAAVNVPGGKDRQSADAGSAQETGYDFLFAATQARTVEDAAVRPADDVDADPPFPIPVAARQPQQSPAPRATVRPVPPVPGNPLPPRGLIDAVPWLSDLSDVRPSGTQAVARSRPPVLGSVADPDGVDGFTVRRADVLKAAGRPAAQDSLRPTVRALVCPRSHANPLNSASCRLCGMPLAQQDPLTVPRPVLGVLRLSTGDVITLDRGVIMGRSPRTEFDGQERPHVVKLPGGDGEISRTHLEISLDGWNVLVTDLQSTNGTLVALPGRDAERLRPHEPLLILPGALVTLADGIDFRYEVTE